MARLKSVRLKALRTVGRSITSGQTYIGYIDPSDDNGKYDVETNFGSMKSYKQNWFQVQE
tara:strand:+ start:623 stop:802 length:180 start_codon:yes stop_codon:yes gene_type:complete